MAVRNLHVGSAALVDDIWPKILKALIKVGVVWLTCPILLLMLNEDMGHYFWTRNYDGSTCVLENIEFQL